MSPPVAERPGPMRKAMLLLRDGKTAEARVELERLRAANPDDAEVWHQIARSHLFDFNRLTDVTKRRLALNLAMEALGATLKRNPDHVPALRAKAVIHARAELLQYDPNLAFELASRAAKIEPHANAYLLELTEWLSGEVRFTHDADHRVPHDPLLGLDRSIDLLERLLDDTMPFSAEEAAAYFNMGKALSRRGNFKDAIFYFRQALTRTQNADQQLEANREIATAYYRSADFIEAARFYYQALQVRRNPIDLWLLRVALDQIEGQAPPLPAEMLFPIADMGRETGKGTNLSFEDIAPKLGVNRLDGNGTCAWGDFDGDGDLDLFLSGAGTFIAVFRNDGGKFTEVTAQVGLAKVPSGYSLNVIDYDNDGKLDLYICLNGWSGPFPNRLFRNIGGRFEDVSKKSGADDPGNGFVSVWGDLDNDGLLDLLIANGVLKDGSVPQVYRNKGDGTFQNITREAGIVEPPDYGVIGAALGDYDKDGDLDILINGLNAAPNRLYRNEGNWKFTEVSAKAGVVQPPHNGFVCFFFDYNNDSWPDILTASLAPWPAVIDGLRAGYQPTGPRAVHPDANRLFRNNRDGTFTDVTFESKLYFPTGSMGAGVADVDNDGFIDVYLGTGDPQLTRLEPNRFFRNNGDGTFSDLTRHVGFARPGNKGHGVTFVDLDEDGDLEIYAQLGGHYPGDMAYNAFYWNLSGNRSNWLEIELTGTKSNRFAVGAQITLETDNGMLYREVKGSEGFGSTNPYRVHFGLGRRQVTQMKVRWPSGLIQTFKGVPENSILLLTEGAAQFTRRK